MWLQPSPDLPTAPTEVVMSLSKCYSSLLDSMNAEIRIRWLQIVVRNDYYPDLHRVRRFLESQVQLLAQHDEGVGGGGQGGKRQHPYTLPSPCSPNSETA